MFAFNTPLSLNPEVARNGLLKKAKTVQLQWYSDEEKGPLRPLSDVLIIILSRIWYTLFE